MKTVKMVRRIREAHYQELKDKTWDERISFYKEQARLCIRSWGLGSSSNQSRRRKLPKNGSLDGRSGIQDGEG